VTPSAHGRTATTVATVVVTLAVAALTTVVTSGSDTPVLPEAHHGVVVGAR
jgi:hypothetical protein